MLNRRRARFAPGRATFAPGRATRGIVLGLLVVSALLAGCGGGSRQDASEPASTFEMKVAARELPRHASRSRARRG